MVDMASVPVVIPRVVLLNEQVSAMEGLAVYRYDMAIRPIVDSQEQNHKTLGEHLFLACPWCWGNGLLTKSNDINQNTMDALAYLLPEAPPSLTLPSPSSA